MKLNSTRIIPPLLAKTVQIVKKNHIKKISEDCYIVKATHDPIASHYLVRKENGTWKCSCREFQFRGKCSHSLAVFLLERG
ncbi:SWIM zinc finger family protein [Candidatus Bathyarchaeota archaeon]|nr:MAG: SWIM zinc finger family protein [Candidatus Bathyarchaeota archaeon]